MRPSKHIRLVSIILGFALIMALYTIGTHFGLNGITRRPLVAFITISCVLLLIGTTYVTWMSPKGLEQIQGRVYEFSKPSREDNKPIPPMAILVLVVAAIGFLALTSTYHAILIEDTHGDPAAFLRFASETQQNGGVLQLLSELYSGQYIQANQHPFYISLLSLSPNLTFGKALSFSATVATFLLITVYLIKVYHWRIAAITATLLATNHAFSYFSGLATCEAWLTLFVTTTWISTDQALKSRTTKRAHICWLAAGLLMGLAYLTKGTGLLFLCGVTLAAGTFGITHQLATSPGQKTRAALTAMAVVIGGWLITAHPLLVRNTVVYGSPTFNVNSYFLYMDEFPTEPEIQATLSASDSLAEVRREFLKRHSISDLIQREIKGIGWETFIFTRSLGPSPLGESRVLAGVFILLLMVLAVLHLERSMQIFVLSLITASILVFAWYVPIAAGERFTAPILPLMMIYAGMGMHNIVSNQSGISTNSAMLACLCWTVIWSSYTVFAF